MKKWLSLLFLIGCTGDVEGLVVVDTDVEDTVGPDIQHTPIVEPQVYGKDIWLEATATDEQSTVWVMMVVFQPETANEWSDMPLSEVGGGLYQGQINGGDVRSGGMRYFLRGIDELGNEGCLPVDCESNPWHFAVIPDN
jgi:hypothetical protein